MKQHRTPDRTTKRWLRLAAAVVFAITGIVNDEPLACLVSAFFAVEALLNVGIFGMAANAAHRPATVNSQERRTLEPIETQELVEHEDIHS